MPHQIAYHFTARTLRGGSPIPPIGEWLEHTGEVVPCKSGLHASPDPWAALQYAPGPNLHRVELGGIIVPDGEPLDKWAASRRRRLASADLTSVFRQFAREQALSVLHLWDAPPFVREYLETGDESKRRAAAQYAVPRATAAAARYAAENAAAAAYAAAAAAYAARAAAYAAAYAAADARAARAAARTRFNQLANEALDDAINRAVENAKEKK